MRSPHRLSLAALVLACAGGALAQETDGAPMPAKWRPPPAEEPSPSALLLGQSVRLPEDSDRIFNRYGFRRLYALTYHRPLLVLGWRVDDPIGSERAVPAALRLQERYGDDLVVLLVERSGLAYADMLRFAAGQHWLCGAALWTSDAPAGTEALGAPHFAFTSLQQTIVLTGDLEEDRAALQAAIEGCVEERQHGAADLPPEAREAWRALHEGHLAKALDLGKAIDKRRARHKPGDAEAAELLEEQGRLIDAEVSTRLDVATELVFQGAAAESFARVRALFEGLKDLPAENALRKRAFEALQGVRDGDLTSELKASEDLLELQDQLCRNGPGTSLARALRKLAEVHGGTHVAERALVLARVADGP